MLHLEKTLAAKDAAVKSFFQDLCLTPWMALWSRVENACVALNKSVSGAFHAGYTGSKFHFDTTMDSISLHFREGDTSENGGKSTEGNDVFDLGDETEVTEL